MAALVGKLGESGLWTIMATCWILFLVRRQSDQVEGHFGHLRKLAGGIYQASVRRFLKKGRDGVRRLDSVIRLHTCDYRYRDV